MEVQALRNLATTMPDSWYCSKSLFLMNFSEDQARLKGANVNSFDNPDTPCLNPAGRAVFEGG